MNPVADLAILGMILYTIGQLSNQYQTYINNGGQPISISTTFIPPAPSPASGLPDQPFTVPDTVPMQYIPEYALPGSPLNPSWQPPAGGGICKNEAPNPDNQPPSNPGRLIGQYSPINPGTPRPPGLTVYNPGEGPLSVPSGESPLSFEEQAELMQRLFEQMPDPDDWGSPGDFDNPFGF